MDNGREIKNPRKGIEKVKATAIDAVGQQAESQKGY